MKSANGNRPGVDPTGSLVGNIAELGNDVATLAELQAKLAVIDAKESLGYALVPLGAIAASMILLMACLPVALIGLAELLASALEMPQKGWAYLIVVAVATVLAILIAWLAISRLGRSFESLRRSKEELSRNIAWIRTVLLYSGRSIPRQKR